MPTKTIKVDTKVCVCIRCGYQWEPRVDNPKACPDCRRRDWR